MTWRAHPARENPGRAALAIAVLLAVAAMVTALCLADGVAPRVAGIAGIAAAGLLLLALHRFFFVSRYEIDDEGVVARSLMRTARIRWADVRRFLLDGGGGFLSTRARSSRLDAWNGVHLLFDHRRDDVVAEIRRHITRARNEEGA